jgi:poly(3-hydroxybutyrate) depolymerase
MRIPRRRFALLATLALATSACSDLSATPTAAPSGSDVPASRGLTLQPDEYAVPGIHEVALTIQGTERSYSLLVPESYDPSERTPLVLAFHGYTMSPTQMVFGSWGGIAEEFGFLLAAPAGLDARWAVARTEAEAAAALPNSLVDLSEQPTGDRDVALAAAVVADVAEYLNVDQDRIFATGVSLGGYMASRVVCEIGEHFAALGPTLNSLLYAAPCPTQRRPAVASVGSALDSTHAVVDAQTAAAAWAEHNRCSGDWRESPHERSVTLREYEDCGDDAPIVMYVHEFSWAGDSAERLLWEFFSSIP